MREAFGYEPTLEALQRAVRLILHFEHPLGLDQSTMPDSVAPRHLLETPKLCERVYLFLHGDLPLGSVL